MANSANYNATKEDSRSWVTDHATRAGAIDEAAVANAATLEAAAQASNPVTVIVVDATEATVTAATGTEHTHQISVTGYEATTGDYDYPITCTYESSSTALATVDEDGVVTGVSAGTATMTVTAVHDTAVTDEVTVTVS